MPHKDDIYNRLPALSTKQLRELEPLWKLFSERAGDNPLSPHHRNYIKLRLLLDERKKKEG